MNHPIELNPAMKDYANGNTTVHEFIDRVAKVGERVELPELWNDLIFFRHKFHTECMKAMDSGCTKDMLHAYKFMVLAVRIRMDEDGANL